MRGRMLVPRAARGGRAAGVLLRSLALGLLGAFLFLSAVLGENPLGHVLFYGALITLVTGGAGRWARPVAGGEPTRLGGSARALPAAAAS